MIIKTHNSYSKLAISLSFFFIFVLFLGIRIFAWKNTVLLEDMDSIYYLKNIDAYHSLDINRIQELNADSTPLYPMVSALIKTWISNTEVSARLTSFFFSILLFFIIVKFTNIILDHRAALIAGLLLAINPMLISLSFSVLTEQTYMTITYLGLLVLAMSMRGKQKVFSAALLGMTFGIAFLTRTEGILFLFAIPFFIMTFWPTEKLRTTFPHRITWSIVFIVVFLFIAIPQVIHVSKKMGTPALNGRVAWQCLVTSMPNKSHTAVLWGLDFSDDTVNIDYIRKNFNTAKERMHVHYNMNDYSKRFIKILYTSNTAYLKHLPSIITPLGCAFSFFGILFLFRREKGLLVYFSVLTLAVFLVPPLTHTNILPRHLSTVIPFLIVLQAVGMIGMSSYLRADGGKGPRRTLLTIPLLLVLVIIGHAFPLKETLWPPSSNKEYDPAFLHIPAQIVNAATPQPTISSNRSYIGYYTNGSFYFSPYTDFSGLVRYFFLNKIDFLYVDYEQMSHYPYISHFSSDLHQPFFNKIWEYHESGNAKAALFKFNPDYYYVVHSQRGS